MTLNISVVSHNHDPQPFPDVTYCQTIWKRKGLYLGIIDGDYGDLSRKACVKYQRQEGLNDDGIVGPVTFKRLQGSDPHRPALTEAARMADIGFKLVTTGIDGTRPKYVFGSETSMTNPSPDAIDCSELVQWAVTQVDGHTWIDGSRWQYGNCRHISVAQAIKTKGALLFHTNNGRESGIHHVAISMGNGKTAEARSSAMGCGTWEVGTRFNLAGLIPVLKY